MEGDDVCIAETAVKKIAAEQNLKGVQMAREVGGTFDDRPPELLMSKKVDSPVGAPH